MLGIMVRPINVGLPLNTAPFSRVPRARIPAFRRTSSPNPPRPWPARYLEECLPRAEYWDVLVSEQTGQTAPARILQFLASARSA